MKRIRKILSVALCAALFISLLFSIPCNASSVLIGDVTLDGKISADDARLIMRISVGNEAPSAYIRSLSDLDGTGTVSSADARIALLLAVGDITPVYASVDSSRRITGFTPKGYPVYVIDGITYVDGVLIANKTYSLPESYNPAGILPECQNAFNRMKNEASSLGLSIYISSGFRSYSSQKSIYNRYVSRDGKALADTYSARPGHSEHQTGLSIDLNTITQSFGRTREGRWVAEHCHEYGFIIRYPQGKSDITGYCYEPWHLRYVGVEAATKIAQSGLCLEEYYGITSFYN